MSPLNINTKISGLSHFRSFFWKLNFRQTSTVYFFHLKKTLDLLNYYIFNCSNSICSHEKTIHSSIGHFSNMWPYLDLMKTCLVQSKVTGQQIEHSDIHLFSFWHISSHRLPLPADPYPHVVTDSLLGVRGLVI